VHRLQPSSGSARAAKLIPYTRGLQRELSRAIDPWIADLYRAHPRVVGGPSYWSVTPPFQAPAVASTSVVPVGFEDDTRYLGGARAWLARVALVAPTFHRGRPLDLDAFHLATLRALLLARDLRLISIWHPSFLLLLIDALAAHWDRLLDDVGRADRRRADEIRAARPDDVRRIWPSLAVVSCWADGASRPAAAALRDRLSGIACQPKGLIATEGVVTIPFGDRRPVAIRSHFYEFIGDAGRARLAHELEIGREYAVVLTTAGGLYRYRLGDRVRVDGFAGRTPSLAFVGRDDRVCDACGEKLSDGFVAGVIDALCRNRERPRFAMLAPDEGPDGRAYTLFVDGEFARRPGLAHALEAGLRRNPHYAWCVDLGQLRPARVAPVGEGADRRYVDACVARGRRIGDVKPVSLDPWPDWRRVLTS
jgi:hypothetical protein